MKDVPAVKWPTHPAHVGAFGPFSGRSDYVPGMDPTAVLTPSAEQEEVPGDESQQGPAEDNCGEPVEPA